MSRHRLCQHWRVAVACLAGSCIGAAPARAQGFQEWLKRDRDSMRKVERIQEPPGDSAAARAPASAPPAGRAPMQIRLPLPGGAAGGHIVFARLVSRKITWGTGAVTVPIPKIFAMTADGADARELITSPGWESVKEPRWSPGYKALLFVSDYLCEASTCMEDIFTVNADGTGFRRVTGGQPAAVAAFGSVHGIIEAKAESEPGPLPPTLINITAQGGGAIPVHPAGVEPGKYGYYNYAFTLPRVAAGELVWIKVWKEKFTSAIHFLQVLPNQANDAGTLILRGNSLFASRPSASPDGRYVVGVGSLAGWQPPNNPDHPAVNDDGTLNALPIISGTDSVCVYDAANNGMLVQSYEPNLMIGESAKEPALSPDGQLVALCHGRAVQESLVTVRFADLLAKRYQPRVLVQGGNVFPSEATMFQAVSVANGSPAWSPDSRRIVFSRVFFGTQTVTAQLFVVNADGTGLRQLTQASANQIMTQPCFSPDGARVAFTVLTGRAGVIKPEDLALRNCVSDIYTIGSDGTGLRQLTRDGVSGWPAWGP